MTRPITSIPLCDYIMDVVSGDIMDVVVYCYCNDSVLLNSDEMSTAVRGAVGLVAY